MGKEKEIKYNTFLKEGKLKVIGEGVHRRNKRKEKKNIWETKTNEM